MEINKFLLLSLSLVLILAGIVESFDYLEKELESEEGLQALYDRWRSHHKVEQKSPERFNVFKSKVQHVHNANKMNRPYKLELNSFADLTAHEIKNTYADAKTSHYMALQGSRRNNVTFTYKDVTNLPPRIDWREHNAVTPVVHQCTCACGWAYSPVGSVEGINAIRTGPLLRLSAQQIVDCDSASNGCDGGTRENAYKYIVENGLATDDSYPYTVGKNQCDKNKFGHQIVKISGFENTDGTEEQLMKAVAHQPVSIMMESNDNFYAYKEGIYNGPCGFEINRPMLVVGYDESPEGKYWIVKNSWGERWGERGYVRVLRGGPQPQGVCGINMKAMFPHKDANTPNVEL